MVDYWLEIDSFLLLQKDAETQGTINMMDG
jgi:hypothetical protein